MGVTCYAQVKTINSPTPGSGSLKLIMANKYGGNAALSYNQYLRVPELIALQTCRSNPIHHDELLFITIHQSFELWFKQILHELDASFGEMNKNRAAAAARALRRVVEIQKLLVNQIHILETMAPANFLGFRDELNPASGFQSIQFREIEFASGLKDTAILENFHHDEFTFKRLQARFDSPSLGEAFFGLLRQRGCDAPADNAALPPEERKRLYGKRTHAVVEVLADFEQLHEEFQLAEALLEHDEYFSLWRSHHVKVVERMVGTKRGTGGSEGVGYLRTTLNKRFFPELWEARTFLSVNTRSGCPFAND
jgi:tryptophan 2,3-dioxygenase